MNSLSFANHRTQHTHAAPRSPAIPPGAGLRLRAVQGVRAAIEILVLALVCLSPWAFGAVEPVFEYLLDAGLALVLALWGVRVLLEWKFSWKRCPVTLCLAGLFLIGIWQLVPLPRAALQWLSPAAGQLYERLLPVQGEVFPGGEERAAVQPPAGSTVSLYPTATHQELVRLLAVVLLFAAVRNNITSRAAFWRFSIVALANGALLALLGLIQFFTSPHHVLYWTWPSAGQVFGPFICRNHFPYYINVCLGLGAGVLLYARARDHARARTPSVSASDPWWERARQTWSNAISELLADPWGLWVVLALAVMLTGVVFSLSRGGLLSLLGGLFVCLAIQRVWLPRSSSTRYVVLVLVLGLMLGAWFGLRSVEARLASLWQGSTIQDARLSLWSRLGPLVRDYPLWGTGLGTLLYVEPLTRTSPTQVGLLYDHAHNDYLEVLVEGGVIGLLLAVAALAWVYRLGYRALRRGQGSRSAGLALGGLSGITTVAIHSIGDFGLHVPAITVLVTVLAAHLCSLGSSSRPQSQGGVSSAEGEEYTVSLGGLAPVLGAAAVAVLGWVIYTEGWKADLVHRFQVAAIQADGAPAEPGHDYALEYLEAGVQLAPEYAGLQVELGTAHLSRFEGGMRHLEAHVQVQEAVQTLAAAAPSGLGGMAQAAVLSTSGWVASSSLRRGAVPEEERLTQAHLVPALRHLVRARDLCPLTCEPHVRIAAHREILEKADPSEAYLERAKFLMTPNPELWYQCGLQEFLDGDVEQAARSWRRCLELADRHLPQILGMIGSNLSPSDLLEQLLPEKPELLVAAASQLYSGPRLAEEGRPFLEKALALLEQQPRLLKAEELHTAAVVHRLLDHPAQALQAYQAALEQKPNQVRWRLELAHLLNQEGFLRESQRELLVVLAREPGQREANQLLQSVRQRLATER
jgi:O-antigen ligase